MPPKSAAAPEVHFTNLGKIFFPEAGFTKGDLIQYYLHVGPHLLPHLKNRPVTLIRYPDGITGGKFYEKNVPRFAPDWITTFDVPRRRESGAVRYILINDARTLAWCANLAALELHPFLHRVPDLDRPTQVVFDFDPGEGADILTCGEVAFLVKELLDQLGLDSFPKVSGSKGIQLYVPLNTDVTYEATSTFAKAMAQLLERQHPDLVLSDMSKQLRKGKVFIDWSQNGISKTTVGVYSLRGKSAQPYASLPVTWEELRRAMRRSDRDALFFTADDAIKRLKKTGDLFEPLLKQKQKLPKEFKATLAPADEALGSYSRKRDFTQTREPKPKAKATSKTKAKGKGSKAKAANFVIQKHAASHLHYDFRLEMDGTLKSWAVPKGVPTELGVKRSAFQVEDHPLGYMKFEGTIPKGQYGGGTVMVWDLGTYELIGGSLASGNLKLILHGKKLKGEWHLFRIRSDEDKPVWLIAKSGKAAKAIGARSDDRSVLSGRSMARIASDNDAEWSSDRK